MNDSRIDQLARLPLLTLEQAAALYQFKPSTLRRWCRERKIGCIRLGKLYYLRPSDITEFLNSHRQEAKREADVILIRR